MNRESLFVTFSVSEPALNFEFYLTYLDKVDKRLVAALENVLEHLGSRLANLATGVWNKLRHVALVEEFGLALALG